MTAAYSEKAKASPDPNITIQEFNLGVWKLKIGTQSGKKLVERWDDIKSALPLFYRLCSDIFIMEPRLSAFFLFCQIWSGVKNALLMHFSTALLRAVCHSSLSLGFQSIWDLDRGWCPQRKTWCYIYYICNDGQPFLLFSSLVSQMARVSEFTFWLSFLALNIWFSNNVLGLLKTRVKSHFEMILLKGR